MLLGKPLKFEYGVTLEKSVVCVYVTAPYPTSGAAISTCEMLQFLCTLGFPCEAFCASRLDSANESLRRIPTMDGTASAILMFALSAQ